MPENEPLLEELCKTFNMKKEDKREFVIRAHIIEAKGMQEALRTVFSQNVMSTELSPTVRVSWIKGKVYEVVSRAHTKIRPKSGNPTYDELIVLKKHMTLDDFYHSKVRFEILNAHTWETEKVLSEYEFPIKNLREKNENTTAMGALEMRPYNPAGNEVRDVWFVMHKPGKEINNDFALGGFLRATVSAWRIEVKE